MRRNNPHLIGICSIAVVSVAAFWGFGLAEKIMPQEKISQIIMPNEDQRTLLAKNSVLSSASATVEPKDTPKPAPEKKPSKTESAKQASNLELLEKKDFVLNLSGIYYAGSPSASKPAHLTMKIRPIAGSNLEIFDVLEAQMSFDNSRVSTESLSVSIKGRDVTMTFVSDAVGSFEIKGTLDDPILSDKNNKQALAIQNQLFYLAQKAVPYHIDMAGTLST